ncbi:Sodium/glutamate symporter [bioreactor metagenome]|uniref:Sodium/glutamate symporter n=2 Tax=root TaxID=1 RepID=A0A645IKJ5_9ZZZZ
MALIGLKLWELAAVAGPMLVILVVQTVMMFIFATYITFNLTGKDYDATVMAAGHCGFGMGATPVAMANMRSVVERFGQAPRAFFVLPIVGAFLIDFSNALIITTFANIFAK